MAVREVRSCDLDATDGAKQHVLAFDGVFISLDLCGKDEEALEKALARFFEIGTEISAAEARKITAGAGNSTEVDPQAVRAWAPAQNPLIKLGLKGSIPAEVTAKYLAATQQ